MMVKVLVYAYCIGVASSRRIALRLHEDIAFRVLAANNTPTSVPSPTSGRTTWEHWPACQVLELCWKAGLVKLGSDSIWSHRHSAPLYLTGPLCLQTRKRNFTDESPSCRLVEARTIQGYNCPVVEALIR